MTLKKWLCIHGLVLWFAGSIVIAQQQRYRIVEVPEAPVMQLEIQEVQRRLELIESIHIPEKLARIETLMEQQAKANDASRTLLIGVFVPVFLLAVSEIARWFRRPKQGDRP